MSELRRFLEPDLPRGRDSQYILNVSDGYAFSLQSSYWLDTEAFNEWIDRADPAFEQGNWAKAAEALEEAVQLYRGEFLAEDRYAEWTQNTRSHLRLQYLDALRSLASCYAELGRFRQAISCCQRILALQPHSEQAIRQLMSYQAETGQRARALETYSEACRTLREHLDVDPSKETQALFMQLSEAPIPEQEPLDPRRIAVLPLASYSPRPEDAYFADGMTEELIGSLSKVKDLQVVARTSVMRYRETTKPISRIARELSVGTILEGSVRKVGGRVRISAQLIDALSEHHLWAEHYDFELGDILDVQAEIARKASEALKLELLSNEEEALRTVKRGNSEAHVAYLKGRHFLEKYTKVALETAIRHFEEALRKDPGFARALTGLADAHFRMVKFTSAEESYRRSKEYAERALALDDSLPEVYTALAAIAGGHDGDLEEKERLLRRAIRLDPSCAIAYAHLANVMVQRNRRDEAVETVKTALALDPLSPRLISFYAECLFAAESYVKAVEQARKALDLDPENDDAWWVVWFGHAALWDWARGEAILRNMVEKYPENPLAYVFLSVSVQTNGRIAEGVALLEKALALPGATERVWVLHQGGINFIMARDYARALRLLDAAVERWPMHTGAHIARAFCYFMQGLFDRCLDEVAVADGLPGWYAYSPRLRARVYAARGETEKAEAELETLIEHTEFPNRRMCTAYVLAGLGRIEEAIDWFEAAADAHEFHIATIRNLPTAPRELREHPRFVAFLKRVGLADNADTNAAESIPQKKK